MEQLNLWNFGIQYSASGVSAGRFCLNLHVTDGLEGTASITPPRYLQPHPSFCRVGRQVSRGPYTSAIPLLDATAVL